MSILFLGANRIPGLSKNSLLGMIAFVYVVLLVIPGLILANSTFSRFSLFKPMMLTALIFISMYVIASRIKTAIKTCGNLAFLSEGYAQGIH